jgi:hypothetical protein
MKFMLSAAAVAALTGVASAAFTGYSVEIAQQSGGLTAYQLFADFDGATDTVLNAFQIHNTDGSGVISGFYHSDALTGGVSSNVAGTWNPQFVLVPGAMDSYVCIGGGTGFASGNSTAADPGWGVAGFNQAGIADTAAVGVAGWFNQNPPNLQGQNVGGRTLLGQFVLADSASMSLFLKIGYNSGVSGSPVQFGEGIFTLPAPGAVALLGLAGLAGRRRR